LRIEGLRFASSLDVPISVAGTPPPTLSSGSRDPDEDVSSLGRRLSEVGHNPVSEAA